jgi:hypothetical protein
MKTKNLILLEAYMKTKIQEAQANLKEGETLNTDELAEGIFDGLKNMFSKDSTVGKGAANAAQGARDIANQGMDKAKAGVDKVKQAGQAAVDKTKQVAGDIKADYQVGNGAGEMKKIAGNLAKLDQKFATQKADLGQRWSAINKERAQFKQSYKAAKAQLQASLEPVYQKLAQALKVDTTQAGWMDTIDATLKQKNLAA